MLYEDMSFKGKLKILPIKIFVKVILKGSKRPEVIEMG